LSDDPRESSTGSSAPSARDDCAPVVGARARAGRRPTVGAGGSIDAIRPDDRPGPPMDQ